ncbi:FAD-binding oxidoreductase [Streptomyces sp. NPDC093510]|uniref:NAD(P)/FAD-dependent oxidoreductase n=1 Tax=Streptomyces sp. NPDC093510 TaxID=3155199 RepID=UPI0034394731
MTAGRHGDDSTTADVVVIGGGINGAAAAFHLATRGAGRVVLLDVPSPRSATPKSGAMLTLHHPSLPQASLAHAGLRELARVPELTGLPTGFTRSGIVHLLPPRYANTMRDAVAAQQAAGIPVRELPLPELAALFPGADLDDVGAAVVEPDSGYADPVLTTRAYLEGARRAGADVRHTAVRRVLTGGGRVKGVETEAGDTVSAPAVVLAAGVWSARLLEPLGIDLGLGARRVQITRFRVEPGSLPDGAPVLLDQVRGSWIRPDTPTSLLAGLEMGVPVEGPADGPEGVDQWYVDMCRAKLAGRFAGLSSAAMRGGWAGLIAMSPHGRPVIDELAEATGLFCAVADSGSSFKTAPVVGKCLAEWIVDGAPRSANLTPFGRSRPAGPGPSDDGYGRFGSAAKLAREIHQLRRAPSRTQEGRST